MSNEFREYYYNFQNLPNYQDSTLTLLRTFNASEENESKAAELATLPFPIQMIWGRKRHFCYGGKRTRNRSSNS
ncbi:hypothetical protein M2139_001294 [Enterococcus sp. PF1-24]|uniref:hypothetical protein n=1 Tax=unclassified Enterococcus TaxID=2608891 RepID=UPI0024753524|nr:MULTISPECIES: hypothetical protein [unclassified Enterococcus]MDH6364231.1 hypothetical protein [Enterococcus sp. PFB1-1]MDH6401410.1 hypothetical protein [Enterococcus sp. PF1-24]